MRLIHWIAALPCIIMLLGPMVHNEVHPLILGMPFPLGWLTVWIVITAAVMAFVYSIDPQNRKGGGTR